MSDSKPHSDDHLLANSKAKPLVELAQQVFVPNYAQQPVVLAHGEGASVTDVDGNKYLDLASGIAVTSLGHNHPAIKAALAQAAEEVWHVSNLFYHPAPIKLAKRLVDLLDIPAQALFVNSGGEANEAAIKLARRYHWHKAGCPEGQAQRHEIVSFRDGFHGRTLATVTATAQPKYHEGFHPLPAGFVYADYNDASLECIGDQTAAVIVECIQGEGGIRVAEPDFLQAVRQRCDETGALLIVDEIQTGFCRTGEWFAHQDFGIKPDIVTLAKAMGGGLPIGAMLASTEVAKVLTPGTHGTTFGGNPLACAVSLAVIDTLEKLSANELAKQIYQRVSSKLEQINAQYTVFKEIRGKGAMIGAQLVDAYAGKAGEIVQLASENGLLVLVAGPDVLRLQIPLIISQLELDEALDKLEQVIKQFSQAQQSS